MEFIDVCSLDEIPPGKSRPVRAAGKDVALFNVDGVVHALENSCPHQGAALSGGEFCGHVVKCGAHGLRFDVMTGMLAGSDRLRVATYPVEISGDRVAVAVDANSCNT
jgi:3-phenylpropionate/trans-cinnamate dioxygenase ferredoxin subunit